MKLRLGLLMIAVTAMAFLCQGCGRAGEKPVIKLYDGQWDSLSVNNAIAEFVIEKGYGYPVQTVEMTLQMSEEALPKGNIDLNMEAWQQNRFKWYNEQIKKGNIVNLGMTFEACPQFFVIPKWMAEQYNIKTVFDMKDHWQLFKDPEDASKGVFVNGLPGWGVSDINIVKLEAYGLLKRYNVVSSHSDKALEAMLVRAQENRRPVFAYYWEPTELMGVYDWHILEEPSYSDECWEKVLAAVKDRDLRPVGRACAYNTTPIDKIAHKGLLKKAPDVVTMLKKMNVGLAPLNENLGWLKTNKVQDMGKAAIHYLENYEHRWKSWVTSTAYERIKEAIQRKEK